jgi:hypothetical protein
MGGILAVTYGNGLWLAISQSGNGVLTSSDGITWTNVMPSFNGSNWTDVEYGNGVLAIFHGARKLAKYTKDGKRIDESDLAKANKYPEDVALRLALDTVKDVHTSGMAETAPKWMQHPLGRIFFTFKSLMI